VIFQQIESTLYLSTSTLLKFVKAKRKIVWEELFFIRCILSCQYFKFELSFIGYSRSYTSVTFTTEMQPEHATVDQFLRY